jgi:predicted DNA-binding protein (MmcQ/YjbR family)
LHSKVIVGQVCPTYQLDETVSDDEIWELVKESHSYTEKTLGKKKTKTE